MHADEQIYSDEYLNDKRIIDELRGAKTIEDVLYAFHDGANNFTDQVEQLVAITMAQIVRIQNADLKRRLNL